MQISKLGFGAMRLPNDVSECTQMFDRYLKSGGNFIDTAYVYGGSEEMLKQALVTKQPRDSFLLANKLPPWAVKTKSDRDRMSRDRIFEESLMRCGVDYFDYYLLHCLNHENYETALRFDMFNWLAEQKKKGLVRKIGFSFHDNEVMLEKILAAHGADMEFVFLQLNYLDVERGNFALQHKVALKYDIPIIAMEPIKGGSLAALPSSAEAILKQARPHDSIASWAMRYVAALPGVINTLSGMSSLAQVEDNIATFDPLVPLTAEELKLLDKVMDALAAESSIPCTGCKYCMADCPQHIQIAHGIILYNELLRTGSEENRKMAYGHLPAGQKAADCTSCGACLSHCPQKIDIPAALAKVAKAFE